MVEILTGAPDSLPLEHPDRRDVATKAAYQLEAIALALRRAAIDEVEELAPLCLAIATRVIALAGVVITATDDEVATIAEIKGVLYG